MGQPDLAAFDIMLESVDDLDALKSIVEADTDYKSGVTLTLTRHVPGRLPRYTELQWVDDGYMVGSLIPTEGGYAITRWDDPSVVHYVRYTDNLDTAIRSLKAFFFGDRKTSTLTRHSAGGGRLVEVPSQDFSEYFQKDGA